MSNSKELKDTAINAKKPPYAFVWMLAIIAALVCVYVATGCATIKSIVTDPEIQELAMEQLDKIKDKWIARLEKLPPPETPPVVNPEPGKPVPPVATGDQVPFSSLVWYKPDGKHIVGGFNGSGAGIDRVTLSNLTCDGNNVRYRFDIGLNVWGLGHTEAGAICAVFIERPSGVWEGGKFDWVSTSRASRELKHLKDYNGWRESLPVRGRVAFVIFSADGKRRSNVVATGEK